MIVFTLVVLGNSRVASAQARPDREQWALNDRALDAMEARRFDEAAALWEEALGRGEFNLFWLNRGRALQRLGRCDEARVALRKAGQAPPVQDPPLARVEEALARYLSAPEMGQHCPGRLILACKPAEMTITLDGQPQGVCAARPLTLSPGPHKVRGEAWGDVIEQTVTVIGEDVAEVTLEIAPPADRQEAERLVAAARQHQQEGTHDLARAALTEAARLAPNWGEPRKLLGEESQRRGELSGALKWYSQYLPLCQDAEYARVSLLLQELERALDEERAALRDAQAREEARRDYEARLREAQAEADRERWWWFGGAALALGGGLALDLIPDSGRNAQLDALDFAPLGLYVLSAAALTWGLLLDGDVAPPPELTWGAPLPADRFYLGAAAGWRAPLPPGALSPRD